MKTKSTLWILLLVLIFYISWAIPQFIILKSQNSLLPNLIFSTIFTGLIGCLAPIYLKNKYQWTYNKKSSKKIAGYLFLIIAIVFSIVLSGSLFKVIELKYSWIMILKYILLFFPMSLGIGLFAFLLIPNSISGWTNSRPKSILMIFLISVFFFLGFYIDSLFHNIELAGIMGFIGLLLGLSYFFLRKFWIVYFTLFLIILINTLADNQYNEYQYWIVITSTLISLLIIFFDYLKNKKNLA